MGGAKQTVAGRIEQLRQKIREHEHRYYVLDQPTISDYEFDQLYTTKTDGRIVLEFLEFQLELIEGLLRGSTTDVETSTAMDPKTPT